ncbi:hypothetical protein CNMCM5878_005649 [Aspergillus fumigatiaffinis]|nr:hypothetical protein CNMCM5878_005649 [Aspergillus fumigatiaffinis]
MTGSRAVLYVLWFWFLGQAVSAQTCYFPNGQQAINDTACTANSVSICCQRGATCLGNGLCFDPFGSAVGGYIRGSCTDRSWQSSNCPQYCTYDNKTAGLYNTLSDAGVLSCDAKRDFLPHWKFSTVHNNWFQLINNYDYGDAKFVDFHFIDNKFVDFHFVDNKFVG